MTRYVVGIDGGGTCTRALLLDEFGQALGLGVAGPSNYDDVGVDAARESIQTALMNAKLQAKLSLETPVASVFFGMAGVVSERDRRVIADIADQLGFKSESQQIGIDHDCRIALAGGLSGRSGMVMITGTGSSVYGMNVQGESWRTGGWGHLISDEGSSYWLGLQALRLAVMAYDGRIAPTSLMQSVMTRLGIQNLNDIMYRIYAQPFSRADVAALAPLIFEAHQAGDPHTPHVLAQAVQDLAHMVKACAQRLGLDKDEHCELAQVGGLLKAGEAFIQPLHDAIKKAVPNIRICDAEMPPVCGAGLLAIRQLPAQLSAEADILAQLKQSTMHLIQHPL